MICLAKTVKCLLQIVGKIAKLPGRVFALALQVVSHVGSVFSDQLP
jgi:hypothetical protein